MDTVDKLDHLLMYLLSRRRVGHTKAMLRGANNTDQVIVLVANEQDKQYVRQYAPHAQFTTWENLRLLGINYPLVIDNHALSRLLADTLSVISELERENKQLRNDTEVSYRITSRLPQSMI